MITGYIPCHSSNCTEKQGQRGIQFLVLHYTGNNGDTAKGNCKYFSSPDRNASAHYFVDEREAWQSVQDKHVAWHCGSSRGYKHPACRNANSIGIEMCSRIDSKGNYYIAPETVEKAVRLTKALMDKYGIPEAHILRHWDVTGKECPRPWVREESQWRAFLEAIKEEAMSYEKFKEYMQRYEAEQAGRPPAWGKEEWEEAMLKNIVDGHRPMSPLTRLEYAVSELRREKQK